MKQKIESDTSFVSYPLSMIFPDKFLPGDVYLYLDGHFIKYKETGDFIPAIRFNQFMLKKHKFIFVQINDLEKFKQWSTSIQDKIDGVIIQAVGQSNAELVPLIKDIKKAAFDFLSSDAKDQIAKDILDKTRAFVAKVNERQTTQDYLLKMLQYDQGMADHGLNVANISTYLAINLGYTQQIILENIYLGALLHDFGKTLIKAKFLENPESRAYKQAILKHPEYGKNELIIRGNYPEDVLKIVSEHHEKHDGTGYPGQLKGTKIYQLTKIVSIANDFDNIVMSYKGEIPKRQANGLKELEQWAGTKYDPVVLPKAIKALKLVLAK